MVPVCLADYSQDDTKPHFLKYERVLNYQSQDMQMTPKTCPGVFVLNKPSLLSSEGYDDLFCYS